MIKKLVIFLCVRTWCYVFIVFFVTLFGICNLGLGDGRTWLGNHFVVEIFKPRRLEIGLLVFARLCCVLININQFVNNPLRNVRCTFVNHGDFV